MKTETERSLFIKTRNSQCHWKQWNNMGSSLHINLEEHLSQDQYKQLFKSTIVRGCSYWTVNVKSTICNECGYIDKSTLTHCPKCGSENIDYATRIIGYLQRVSNFSKDRKEEESRRNYSSVTINETK